jgi:hypothetical protein
MRSVPHCLLNNKKTPGFITRCKVVISNGLLDNTGRRGRCDKFVAEVIENSAHYLWRLVMLAICTAKHGHSLTNYNGFN